MRDRRCVRGCKSGEGVDAVRICRRKGGGGGRVVLVEKLEELLVELEKVIPLRLERDGLGCLLVDDGLLGAHIPYRRNKVALRNAEMRVSSVLRCG